MFWPGLLLIFAAVIPTVGVLWFASLAMKNADLAARQQLADAARAHLAAQQVRLAESLSQEQQEIETLAQSLSSDEFFERMLTAGFADSVLRPPMLDPRDSTEQPAPASEVSPFQQQWREAERLEFTSNAPLEATVIYQQIAAATSEECERARALQGASRCLLKGNDLSAAIRTARTVAENQALFFCTDAQRRLIGPNLMLLILQMSAESSASKPDEVADWSHRLGELVRDYSDSRLPPQQRLHLMKELKRWFPDDAFPTLKGEELAARIADLPRQPVLNDRWVPSPLSGFWMRAAASGQAILISSTERLHQRSLNEMTSLPAFPDTTINLLPPETPLSSPDSLVMAASPELPGWRLELAPATSPASSRSTGQWTRGVLHFWSALLLALGTVGCVVLLARTMRRQLALTRLKNDLLGTVSHELRTPLSAMRVLVDTLLEYDGDDRTQTREYLALIANENLRLTRLVENFLSFSRLEQGRHPFAMQQMNLTALIQEVLRTTDGRFRSADCRMTTSIASDLPEIWGDPDALATVLLNLLDNACKYSRPPREITVSAWTENKRTCMAVQDNGIGMTPQAAQRVFDQFFQADQRLTRERQGIGLGLSIVKYILDAHGASISVQSQPGAGTTFTIRFPASSVDVQSRMEAPHD